MGQISVTIQNRTYRLSCDDGEEARLTELAAYVRAKADQLIEEHGRIGDEHLMLMSALLIADELWDERAEKSSSKTSATKVGSEAPSRRKPHEKTPAPTV